MKRKMLTIALIISCLAIMVSGSFAYSTTEERVHNIITTNGMNIAIEEWQQVGTGLEPYPTDQKVAVIPGKKVSKIVTVVNKKADGFVRAKFTVSVKDAAGRKMNLTADRMKELVKISANGTYWKQKNNDAEWWYYQNALGTGESTAALFSEVEFDAANITSEFQNCEISIFIDAQAVQAANNGETALEAQGWPDEE